MFPKYRVLAAALLVTVLGISPVAAQMESNSSRATSGLYSTEVDKFLNVNSWQEVEFDKFFSAIQVDQADGISGGFAAKAGSAYLGFGYLGKFWSGTFNSASTEYGNDYATANWQGKKETNHLGGTGLTWINQVSFLLGTAPVGGLLLDAKLAGMGKNNNDAESLDASGNTISAKNTVGLGSFEAGISWGRNFDLGGETILKPKLGFTYNRNLQKTVSDPGGPGSVETTVYNGVDYFFANQPGYVDVQDGKVGLTGIIAAHAGADLDLTLGGNDHSIWVGYDLETHTYENQVKDSSGYWEDYGPSYMGHCINAGIGAWYTLDRRLSFAWSAESDFALIKAAVTSVKTQTAPAVDHEYADSLFIISPKIAAGVSYKAIPDKLTFNASLALYPLEYTHRKFTHNDQSMFTKKTVDTSNKITSTYTATSLGLNWLITAGLSFDTAIGIVAGSTKADLTAFSALLSYKL